MTSPADVVRSFLEAVIDVFGVEADLSIAAAENEIQVKIDGNDLGVLIGRHGMTIDALEHLLYRAAQNAVGEDTLITVDLDIQEYRKRREFSLQRTAARAASDAVRLREPVELEPMRRFERKIVSSFLHDRPDVYARTSGEEPYRFITVYPRKHSTSE